MHQPPRRRQTDRILEAFHAACDEGAPEIALALLTLLLRLAQCPTRLPTGVDRRAPDAFSGAQERLRNLPRLIPLDRITSKI